MTGRLLAALNTGHDGGAGTVHANTAAEVPARLEALAAPTGMGREALHAQLAGAVHLVLHMRRAAGGRVLAELALLVRGPDGHVVAVPAFRLGVAVQPGAALLADLLTARGAEVSW